jgi:hypothetical protein
LVVKFDVVRDVLDQLLVDRHGREFGRVDGIIVHLRPDKPPRLGEIEIGTFTALRRVNVRLAEWLQRFADRWSPVPLDSVRLPFEDVRRAGINVAMPIDSEADERLLRGEKWLREHVIGKLPGGKLPGGKSPGGRK